MLLLGEQNGNGSYLKLGVYGSMGREEGGSTFVFPGL